MRSARRSGRRMSKHPREMKDTVGEIVNPPNGYRGQRLARGLKVQDHAKQNRLLLREMQRINRIKRASQPEPKVFKLRQFERIPSKVFKQSQSDEGVTYTFMKRGEGLRRKSEQKGMKSSNQQKWIAGQIPAAPDADKQNKRRFKVKPAVPKAAAPSPQPQRSEKNFVQHNQQACCVRPTSAPHPSRFAADHESYAPQGVGHALGEIPLYLRHRKQAWEEAEDRRRSLPSCPPGQQLLPEQERLATLRVLKVSREKELKNLNALPLSVETPSRVHRKQQIELRLKELDEAIEIFSKSKVFTVAQ